MLPVLPNSNLKGEIPHTEEGIENTEVYGFPLPSIKRKQTNLPKITICAIEHIQVYKISCLHVAIKLYDKQFSESENTV